MRAQKLLWQNNTHTNELRTNSVAISADNSTVLTGTNCHPSMIRKFECNNGTLTWSHTLSDNYMCIMGALFTQSKSHFAVIEEFGNLLIYNNLGTEPQIEKSIKLGITYGICLAYSNDEKFICIGGSGGKILIYNVESESVKKVIQAHKEFVNTIDIAHNNELIVSGGNDGKVKIWDFDGRIQASFLVSKSSISKVLFDKNSEYIFISSQKGNISKQHFSVTSDSFSAKVSKKPITSFCLSPDGKYLCTVSEDSFLSFYSAESLSLKERFVIKDSDFGTSVDWSNSGELIAVGTNNGQILMYATPEYLDIEDHEKENNALKVDVYGHMVYINSNKETNANIELKIFDSNGKIMLENKIYDYNNSISLSSFPHGVYFIIIQNRETNFIQSQKIIIY